MATPAGCATGPKHCRPQHHAGWSNHHARWKYQTCETGGSLWCLCGLCRGLDYAPRSHGRGGVGPSCHWSWFGGPSAALSVYPWLCRGGSIRVPARKRSEFFPGYATELFGLTAYHVVTSRGKHVRVLTKMRARAVFVRYPSAHHAPRSDSERAGQIPLNAQRHPV